MEKKERSSAHFRLLEKLGEGYPFKVIRVRDGQKVAQFNERPQAEGVVEAMNWLVNYEVDQVIETYARLEGEASEVGKKSRKGGEPV